MRLASFVNDFVKMVLVVGVLFFWGQLYAQDMNPIRLQFHETVKNPDESLAFKKLLSNLSPESPTLSAYKAVSEALVARVLWNPFAKLTRVKAYRQGMEHVIRRDPTNIEIRFLRMSVEYHLPAFLGMSEHLEEDRKYILSHANQLEELDVDGSFGEYIIYFMEDSKLCSLEEIQRFKAEFSK